MPSLTEAVEYLLFTSDCLSLALSLCVLTDPCAVSGAKPLKPQRSLPGTPVSLTQYPPDLRASMEEKFKEIAEVQMVVGGGEEVERTQA